LNRRKFIGGLVVSAFLPKISGSVPYYFKTVPDQWEDYTKVRGTGTLNQIGVYTDFIFIEDPR